MAAERARRGIGEAIQGVRPAPGGISFETVFDVAAIGLATIESATGAILRANACYAAVLGRRPDELAGTTTLALTHDDDLADLIAGTSRIVASDSGRGSLCSRRILPDGSSVAVHVTISRLDDTLPGHRHVEVLRPLDAQTAEHEINAQLRLERFRLDTALAAARLGTWEVDLRTAELRWSKQAFAIHGRDPAAGPPPPAEFYALVHPDDGDLVRAAWFETLSTGTPSSIDFRSNPERGELRSWHAVMQRLDSPSGEPEVIVGVVQDVTELRRTERSLRESEARLDALVASLEQRVGERTAELEDANRQLEAFSYSVSHDLRAPLRAIDGFARILVEEHAAALPAEAAGYLARIQARTRRMASMIDALLSFAKLGRQRLARAEVDMGESVERAWAHLAADRDGRRIEILVHPLPPCSGDADLLERVLVNLLSNAIKFSRIRDVAHVEVGFDGAYYVRDDGIGYDPRHGEQLFGVFQRLHGEDYDGTGVGLAIAERIVARHGGTMWAEGEPGRGATFHFTLPIVGETRPTDHQA